MLLKARACLRKNKVFIKTKSLSIQRRDFEGGEERVLSMGGGMAELHVKVDDRIKIMSLQDQSHGFGCLLYIKKIFYVTYLVSHVPGRCPRPSKFLIKLLALLIYENRDATHFSTGYYCIVAGIFVPPDHTASIRGSLYQRNEWRECVREFMKLMQ